MAFRRNRSLARRLREEQEEDEDLVMILALSEELERERAPKWHLHRLDWDLHIQRELHTSTFEKKYHMSLSSFNKLVGLLHPLIQVDELQSIRSTSGSVSPLRLELIVAMGLRFLGGEFLKSLEDIFGVHEKYIHNIIFNKFLPAIDATFEFHLPSTDAEKESVAKEFSSLSSSHGIFDGVIGAIDGWLCTTIQPIDRDITDKRSYYSGHYQKFGLNVQAICDARLRFIYFAVAAPGRTNDARAILKCNRLCEWLDTLGDGKYFIVGDNAYVLADHLLIPFSGKSIPEINRTYNYFLSQLRIRIEMAFGRLTTKWRIFRRDLEVGMQHASLICRCAGKLHNYVINEAMTIQFDNEDDIDVCDGAPRNLGYLPRHPESLDDDILYDDPEDGHPADIPIGFSVRRAAIVDHIGVTGLGRPAHNVQRNG